MRRTFVIALVFAPFVTGCGVFFVEAGAGAYGVVGGNADLRPAYGLSLAAGVHIDDPQRDPGADQDWRTAVAIASDVAVAPMGARDGLMAVSGLAGRFDLTLAHPARSLFARGTAIVSFGGASATQLADASGPARTSGGFGMTLFAGPTLTILGSTNTHLSLGAAAILGVPDGFDTTLALGAQARVAFDFGTIFVPDD